MTHRIALLAALACTIFSGTLACSGEVIGGGSSVTSLPPTDLVTADSAQFCSDTATYFDGLAPSLAGLDCANEIAAESSTNAGGGTVTMTLPSCKMEYEACFTAVSSVNVDAGAVKSATASILSGCAASVAKCKGVTIGEISSCVVDFANSIVAISSSVTEEGVCSGKPYALQFPEPPASCKTLPRDCLFSSSVGVSSGGTMSGVAK